jgi:diguanylate cyclase (GGDEF)-like protein
VQPGAGLVSVRLAKPRLWRALRGLKGAFTNERRLVICLALTLIAIQVGLMVFLKSRHDGLTQAAIRDVLQGGYMTVQNQVFEEQESLAAGTKLMASEYGLRQAVATRDQPTIDSMLENHQARSTRIQYSIHPWAGAPSSAADAATRVSVNLLDFSVVRDAGAMQLVTYRNADILAPRPIATLRGTLLIDDSYARRLSKLTGFELIVAGAHTGKTPRVLASSLSADLTQRTFAQLRGALADGDARSAADLIQVSSGGAYSFIRVKALASSVDGDVWLWIGKLDNKAVPALLDAAAAVQGWILASLILSVLAVSALAYKLVRPISASANTDVLTGLPNRRAFMPAAAAAMSACWAQDQPVALLSMDLDKFKPINDTLGHAAGDDVLRAVGARLRSFFRAGDIVARLGGDEFCALLKDVAPDHLPALADRLRAALEAPIERDGKALTVGCSIGVMVAHRDDQLHLEELMDRADAALYRAKRTRATTVFWSSEIGSMKKRAGTP